MMSEAAGTRIAEAFRAAMREQNVNGAELAARIERLTGTAPSPVWVSRRTSTSSSRPIRLLDADPDLFVIARALEINRSDLIELVIRAVFGDEHDEPIPYVPTGKCPDAGVGDHDCAAHVEVPPRPAPSEYGNLPVLDPEMLRPARRRDTDETREMTPAERRAFEDRADFPGWDML